MNIEEYPLWQTQLDLEARMVSDGVDNFISKLNKSRGTDQAGSTGFAKNIFTTAVTKVSALVTQFLEETKKRGGGRLSAAAKYLGQLDPDAVAFIGLKAAFKTVSVGRGNGPYLQSLAIAIGRSLEAEEMVEQFRNRFPNEAGAILRNLDKTTSHYRHRRRVIVHAASQLGFKATAWDQRERMLVGLKVVEAIIETGLFVHYTSERAIRVGLAPGVIEQIDLKNVEVFQYLQPQLLPCVVPPKPWDETCKSGGYWTKVLTTKTTSLVKSHDRLRSVTQNASDAVLRAVNAVQATAWKVNDKVLTVMREVVERGLDDLDVLPRVKEHDLPAKPHDIDTNEEGRKVWRRDAARVHAANSKLKTRRLQLLETLSVAQEFVQYPRVYFPHQLDFRGRVYAMPSWLNPQGPDYAKGLLTFAEGKPIGADQGPGWLAIHGANSFGVDKIPLEDRIDWVEQNSERICRIASEPLSDLWWTEADKPWCFLAWCFEWSGYCAAADAGIGEHFMSCLPVVVDGTCNGLQHYSAMLRDPVGGAATNLIPSERPADIYAAVARRVVERLSSDDSDLGRAWSTFGIDRKITKRPVMVLPYGGTFTSCRDYVESAVREKGNLPFPKENEREAILYLAHVVWDSIGDVVIAAREGMAWLQKTTRLASHSGIEMLSWTTPAGFEVRQSYAKMRGRTVKTAFHGSRIELNIQTPTTNLDKLRQALAVAPNFVHSLDAAALQLTVDIALLNDVTHFAVVHDSYGTHAADMASLGACLRAAFANMYRDHDPLAHLRDRITEALPERRRKKVPPLPERGTLDIELVRQSDFFFA